MRCARTDPLLDRLQAGSPLTVETEEATIRTSHFSDYSKSLLHRSETIRSRSKLRLYTYDDRNIHARIP